MKDVRQDDGGFFSEVKRRQLLRPVLVYVVGCWILLQIADITFEPLGLPEWALTFVILLAVLGLPVVITLGWVFNVTSEGIRVTDTGQRNQINYLIAILFVGAAGLSAALYFWPTEPEVVEVEVPVTVETFGDRKSIAILPFENLSDSKEDAWFASGIHEEILFRVSKVRDLDVKSKTSVIKYATEKPAVQVIGRDMGVGSVLEGSVRRAGDRVRITVQLIDTASDSHLWADSFDRDLKDIFEIQSEVAQSIAGALQATLLPQELLDLESKPTDSIEAYSLYLRALALDFTPGGIAGQLELLEKALLADPDYADAMAALAQIYAFDTSNPDDPNPVSNPAYARELLVKARVLDPDSLQVQMALGQFAVVEFRWTEALDAYQKATELDPTNGDAWTGYANVLRSLGRHREAILAAERGVHGNPGLWGPYQTRMVVNYTAGEYRKALEYLQAAEQLFPEYETNFCWARGVVRHYLEMPGVRESARACYDLLSGDEDTFFSFGYLVGWAAGLGGDRMLAYEILSRYQELEKERWIPPGHYVYLYLGLEERDKALEYLDASAEYRLFIPTSYLATSRAFDALRDDPRFQALLQRVNLADYEDREAIL